MRLVVKTILMSDMEFFTQVRPVEYESAEAFLCDLEAASLRAKNEDRDWVFFAGYEWDLREFGNNSCEKFNRRTGYYDLVEWQWYWDQVDIMTVDEWFNKGK
jgi:hypothetical protein